MCGELNGESGSEMTTPVVRWRGRARELGAQSAFRLTAGFKMNSAVLCCCTHTTSRHSLATRLDRLEAAALAGATFPARGGESAQFAFGRSTAGEVQRNDCHHHYALPI